MRTRNSFVTLLLVTTLLLAPVSLAGPSGDAGFGWFSQVKAFVVDVFDFFGFGEASKLADPADQLQNQRSFVCDPEHSPTADPHGC
jgi:hypothetical protein